MLSIIECDNCGYSRSSEDDGQMFHDVCGICYSEECKVPVGDVVLCDTCNRDPDVKAAVPIIDSGESLFT